MASALKEVIRSVTPPIIWNAASFVERGIACRLSGQPVHGEQGASWYNRAYRTSEEYRKHYTLSCYYFLWTVIVDRLLREGTESILDIGCGPGQFASFLRDKGLPNYHGIDLSDQAINMARATCPGYTFSAGSIFEADVLDKVAYDTVVAMEFLEHVEDDLVVLKRIRKGARFIGSVPDFPYESHVRYFNSSEEVAKRYGPLFDQFTVDTFLANGEGKTFYLIEGVRS